MMEDAGEIDDWGILTHAWGDEYNFNFFVITENHRAFLDAWDSFVQRNNEADPDWYQTFGRLFFGLMPVRRRLGSRTAA